MSRWIVVVASCLLVATGCIEPEQIQCADGRLCPSSQVCDDAHGKCVFPEQLSSCSGKAEAAECAYPGVTNGQCIGGVCFPAGCGNGKLDPGEQCDDGNTASGDGCDVNCTPTGCGNAIVTAGEGCDDGNVVDNDLCGNTCLIARCGDGIIQAAVAETCDDMNLTNGDGCDSNCTPTACGNGIITAGEACDDGNTSDADACLVSCVVASCGDGFLYAGSEGCDDHDLTPGDGCDASCLLELEQSCSASAACASGFCDPSGNTCRCDGNVDCAAGAVCSMAVSPHVCVGFLVDVSPSTFIMRENDTRETLVTVTNVGEAAVTPTLGVAGLTLGTMTFSGCMSSVASGASCAAVATLTATAAGSEDFQVTASASGVPTAMTTLSMTAAACPATCGAAGNKNCCASSIVPGNATGATLAGTSFYRSYDATSLYPDMTQPATISDFRLDTYEVTVGRFRVFVNAGKGTQASPPTAGAGGRTLNGVANQGGWDASWNTSLRADTTALKVALKCDSTYQTWTDTAGANEALPMNCVTWYEAMAFCIWDGGFLPTEAEWDYAAQGGSDQRAYPWSSPASSTSIDCSYANYKIDSPAGTYCTNGTTGALDAVGSESPNGDGRWGQADMAGNVWEWNLDWYAGYVTPCNDCANLTTASYRVYRGGGFDVNAAKQRAAGRYDFYGTPDSRDYDFGLRCARTP